MGTMTARLNRIFKKEMVTGNKGRELIKSFEGCELEAYLDVKGVPTIGWGNTYYEDGSLVKIEDKIDQERADRLFDNLLPRYERTVKNNITRELNQNEFDALVSFCWNCGSSETLFRMVNEKNPDTVEWWKTHYITSGGKVYQGLIRRRIAESNLYIS